MSTEELMLFNCGVGEDSWEFLGGDSANLQEEIQPVHPKGNHPWIFIEKTDAEVETPILWPPDAKNWLIGKEPDAGIDWRQEKGTTEDKMVACHHRLNGHEFEQAPGIGDGQGSLVCCSLWGRIESGMTEWLNWTDLMLSYIFYLWWSTVFAYPFSQVQWASLWPIFWTLFQLNCLSPFHYGFLNW